VNTAPRHSTCASVLCTARTSAGRAGPSHGGGREWGVCFHVHRTDSIWSLTTSPRSRRCGRCWRAAALGAPPVGGAREYGTSPAIEMPCAISTGYRRVSIDDPGESQIQGRSGRPGKLRAHKAGPVLHRLFQTALHVGSRVRTETALGMGRRPRVGWRRGRGEDLRRSRGRSALILGAGDMAELAATCLGDQAYRSPS